MRVDNGHLGTSTRGYAEQESASNPSAALARSFLNADKAARGTFYEM
jgi:hypothetical protein